MKIWWLIEKKNGWLEIDFYWSLIRVQEHTDSFYSGDYNLISLQFFLLNFPCPSRSMSKFLFMTLLPMDVHIHARSYWSIAIWTFDTYDQSMDLFNEYFILSFFNKNKGGDLHYLARNSPHSNALRRKYFIFLFFTT